MDRKSNARLQTIFLYIFITVAIALVAIIAVLLVLYSNYLSTGAAVILVAVITTVAGIIMIVLSTLIARQTRMYRRESNAERIAEILARYTSGAILVDDVLATAPAKKEYGLTPANIPPGHEYQLTPKQVRSAPECQSAQPVDSVVT